MDVTDPAALLLRAAEAARNEGISYAAYGAIALAVWGEPRFTKDADIAVLDASTGVFVRALEATGLKAEPAFERVRFGGLLIGRITVYGEGRGQVNTVDLVQSLDTRYSHRALGRTVAGRFEGRPLSILSPEDFILFKILSTREIDLEDAASVWRRNRGELNERSIAANARGLAGRIVDHDVQGRLRRVRELSEAEQDGM